jgi:hypothetical protein
MCARFKYSFVLWRALGRTDRSGNLSEHTGWQEYSKAISAEPWSDISGIMPPVHKHPFLFCLLSIFLGISCVGLFSCAKKGDTAKSVTVIFVSKGDDGETKTAVRFTMTGPGQEPSSYWMPDHVVIFRVDTSIGEHAGKAGRAYRIQADQTLKEIAVFDLSKTEDQLFEEFSTMPAPK